MEMITLSRRRKIVLFCAIFLVTAFSSQPFAHASWMPTICIDAGHGGIYTGAISPYNGLYEKDANLDIALRIQSLLGAQGYNVVMTRTTDTEVNVPAIDRTGNGVVNVSDDLQARCDVANASGAQCFVSIHNNAGGGSGTETYFWAANYSPDGMVLASLIQEEIIKRTGLFDRGVKGYNFYVLRGTNMPSALVEGAFLDNPNEAQLLSTSSFRQAVAEGVAAGIVRFLTGRYDDGTGDEISSSHFFTWYDYRSPGMNGNWILIGNASMTSVANCNIYIGGLRVNQNSYSIPPGGRVIPTFRGVMNGPVKVKSTNGVPIFTSQRVLYQGSFNEVTGISKKTLSTEFYFTWYDFLSPGMNGNWVLVGNPSSTVTATCDIYIGTTRMGSYTLPPNSCQIPTFRGVMNGPVRVVSTNGRPLFASQRVLYKNSFNEVLGIPKAELSTEYYFTWYDFQSPGMNGNWVLVGNPATNMVNAQVEVYVGRTKKGTYSIPPGGTVTPTYPGLIDGPVRVVCTNGQKIFASQRVLYLDSFNEVLGIPKEDIATKFYFTWYDYQSPGMNGNWVLVGNPSESETANVEIYIGGTYVGSYWVPPLGRIIPTYRGLMNGPVEVRSTNSVPVFTSQRIVYQDSFEEVPGILLVP